MPGVPIHIRCLDFLGLEDMLQGTPDVPMFQSVQLLLNFRTFHIFPVYCFRTIIRKISKKIIHFKELMYKFQCRIFYYKINIFYPLRKYHLGNIIEINIFLNYFNKYLYEIKTSHCLIRISFNTMKENRVVFAYDPIKTLSLFLFSGFCKCSCMAELGVGFWGEKGQRKRHKKQ